MLALAPADEFHGDAVASSLWLGLRRGEVLGLSWETVDLDARQVHIGEMLVRTPDGVELNGPSRAVERRTGPCRCRRGAADVLERRKRRQAEDRLAAGEAWTGGVPGTSGLVFTDGLGEPFRADNYGRVVKPIIAEAG